MKSSIGGHGCGKRGNGRGSYVATLHGNATVLRYHVKCLVHLIMARDITCLIDVSHTHTIDLV